MPLRRRKPGTIRWSLLRSFIALVLFVSLTVLVFMSLRASRTERELSENLIAAGTRQAVHALDSFIDPAREMARIGLQWMRSGRLSLDALVEGEAGQLTTAQLVRARELGTLLLPLLQVEEELSSAHIADAHGAALMVLETPTGGRIRVSNPQRWGRQTLWLTTNADGEPQDHEWQPLEYDARQRPWFRLLDDIPEGDIGWTDPYLFFTTGELGITASGAGRHDGLRYKIAWDVKLTDITHFAQRVSADLSQRSEIIVATPDWRAVALPDDPAYTSAESVRADLLKPLGELAAPVARGLMLGAADRELPATFSFESGGDTWWAGLNRYALGPHHDLVMGVLVPNGDLLQEITQQRRILLAATALALLAALVYALLLARSYSKPLEALAAQSDRIRQLDFSEHAEIEAQLVEFQALARAQSQSLRALQSLGKYVPLDVVHELVKTDQVARIGGRLERITILFTDIAGFTSIAESMAPEALAEHLADYFDCVVHELQSNGATVDKLIGDAVMAFWGAPRPMADHAQRAVEATAAARRALTAANRRWREAGKPELPTRFGLASGEVIVGNMGAQDRLAYTVIGDTVNLASRLEGLNKRYGTQVMAEQSVVDAAASAYRWRRLDRVAVVGRSEPTWVYELLDDDRADERVERYEAAWDLYARREFRQAADILEKLTARHADAPSRRLLALCRALEAEPPAPDWDAVTRPSIK
jgi:adenylate cyclase